MKKKRTFRFAYPNGHEFIKAYKRQDENAYRNDAFYFRGGSKNLADVEDKIAKLVDVEKGNLCLTTSGMSAVITVLEIANLKTGSIVVHGKIAYGQIYNYIDIDLRQRGVIPVEVDAGSVDAIESTLKKVALKYGNDAIKIIFLETIGNGPETPVLDIERFLSLSLLQKLNPLIVFDNTLPTNSIVSLSQYVKESKLRIVGLESTTKFYLFNQDLGGFIFTYRNDLLNVLLTKRKRIGATPGPSLIEKYNAFLPKNKKQFDKKNWSIMKNTMIIAKACSQATGTDQKIIISYPNLSSHQNYTYANKHFKNGCLPVLFITATKDAPFSSEQLFYKLEKSGAFTDMVFTESFGFSKTGVSYASRYNGYIRIAGGREKLQEVKKIGERIKIALSSI
ncbi:MAG: PLP-dependent transferase [Candidatus Levybacteria bacterium]|nr:PLP-dependent transferase [Candidatus Levybacteria bacterium]